MLRHIFMLMALLSGLTALYAPGEALAGESRADRIEVGAASDTQANAVTPSERFAPIAHVSALAASPAPAIAPADFVPRPGVAIRIDRARE